MSPRIARAAFPQRIQISKISHALQKLARKDTIRGSHHARFHGEEKTSIRHIGRGA